jgi:hypothetical protein
MAGKLEVAEYRLFGKLLRRTRGAEFVRVPRPEWRFADNGSAINHDDIS